jgi:hypothetical protein
MGALRPDQWAASARIGDPLSPTELPSPAAILARLGGRPGRSSYHPSGRSARILDGLNSGRKPCKALVEPTICRSRRQAMPEPAALNRPKDRPKG